MTEATVAKVEAAKPLILGGLPIWRAAIEVGWASPQLQIAFKKLEGITPGEWLLSFPESARKGAYRRTLESASIQGRVRHRQTREATREWMCAACGADAGKEKPRRCAKCGSYSFDLSAPSLATPAVGAAARAEGRGR